MPQEPMKSWRYTSFFLICLCRSAQLHMKYVSVLAASRINLWPLRCFCWTGRFINIHPFPELMNFNWPWPSLCGGLWWPMKLMVSLQESHCTLAHLSDLFTNYCSANFDSSGLAEIRRFFLPRLSLSPLTTYSSFTDCLMPIWHKQ